MATKERTTKEVVDDARSHLSELVDAHISLAKAEMAENQRRLIMGIAPLAIAGVLALFVLGFLGVTTAKALDNVVTEGWAWLITSLGVAVVAALLGVAGKRQVDRASMAPDLARESIQETLEWARTKTGKDS